jgi:hypothetical protein
MVVAFNNKRISLGVESIHMEMRISVSALADIQHGRALVVVGEHCCGLFCEEGLIVDPAAQEGDMYGTYRKNFENNGASLAAQLGASEDTMCEVLLIAVVPECSRHSRMITTGWSLGTYSHDIIVRCHRKETR